jgi:hypothetical protein
MGIFREGDVQIALLRCLVDSLCGLDPCRGRGFLLVCGFLATKGAVVLLSGNTESLQFPFDI